MDIPIVGVRGTWNRRIFYTTFKKSEDVMYSLAILISDGDSGTRSVSELIDPDFILQSWISEFGYKILIYVFYVILFVLFVYWVRILEVKIA